MRKLLLAITFLFASFYAVNAQDVTFEDYNLKYMLLYENCVNKYSHSNETTFTNADTNNNRILEQSELDDIRHFKQADEEIYEQNFLISTSGSYEYDEFIINFPSFDRSRIYTRDEIQNLLYQKEITLTKKNLHVIKSLNDFNKFTYIKSIKLSSINCSLTELKNLNELESFQVPFNTFFFYLNLYNSTTLNDYYPVYELYYSIDKHIEDLTFNNCPKLKILEVPNLGLKNINLTNNTSLSYLDCSSNSLTSLDISNYLNLEKINCSNNSLSHLDISNNLDLRELMCTKNSINSLNISYNAKLNTLYCRDNQLIYLNLKNGSKFYYSWKLDFKENPNLKYICVDKEELEQITQYCQNNNINAEVNTYCSFEPAGEKNSITGKIAINCEAEQGHSIKLKKEDGTNTGYLFSDVNGNYETYGKTGTYTLTPIFEHLYYTISPTYKEITFTDLNNTQIVDFCIQPIANKNDLEVKIIPVRGARPGFDAEYKIVYKNKGTTTLSGNLEFHFNDNLSDYIPNPAVTPFQENGKLTFDYTDLKPFESRTILVTLNINPPTETIEIPVNGGDILTYNAVINPTTNDETAQDNEFTLTQTVVNSFDPNDKTCLQGNKISPTLIGEYVDYLIRFENTGSAEAINIIVKDLIDTSMFDVSTLIPTDSSHDYELRIDGNKVEFIFEGINLPFDDVNNDGYVAFKIKTLPTVTLGDELKNKADIYFDFNFPIETNEYVTTVETLSSEEILRQAQNDVSFFPNPASEKVTFSEEVQSVQIFNLSGQLLQTSIVNGIELNVSELAKGNYILKITTEKGIAIEKLIKE
ncbi:MAG: T9SS type A sorting domain-containing protein [Flavobacteriales bacterium]|nr:T9SS type A sorting domain-containing protein [Flavobacteriales bacterium]